MAPEDASGWLAGVRERLLAWFDVEKRPLPWRADRDPYRILVSEMMLVQTTVAAVVSYFDRFVAEFPDLASLAAADEERVLKAWEGLGYYRRARQLHAAARAIVADHGGGMPRDPAAVRALPGVGRYMAGAILSQAFDLPEPIVEANSRRVLARLVAERGEVTTAKPLARLWEVAGRLVAGERAGDFNQALMELGALVCAPREPRCLICPVAESCEARRLGLQAEIPRLPARTASQEVAEACAVVVDAGRVLMVRRAGPGLWAGFWEFPTVHLVGPDPAGRGGLGPSIDLERGVERLTGVEIVVGSLVHSLSYGVTRYRVRLDAHAATPRPRPGGAELVPGSGMSAAAWVEPGGLRELTMSAAGRRLVAAIRSDPAAWGLPE
ncbi:NUDIX domain-containing protein [Paludisphaera sp.]|uniref:A/G-specific adenine glycosylase n=1 Tax=Paludisphaera sp. TaxID=2017432 RepID=UPI00301CC558